MTCSSMEEAQIPGLDASFGAFQTRVQAVLDHDKISAGSRRAIGSALEDLRADLHELAAKRTPEAAQRAALLHGLAGICRRYADILPPSTRPDFPQACNEADLVLESLPDDHLIDHGLVESPAGGAPPMTLEDQVRELAREVLQLEMERDAVLDLLSAQAGVPSPCESQSHSPRIAAHRPEAEGGEECRVGSQTEVAEGGAAEGDAPPILDTPRRDSPLPGAPFLEESLLEAQGKIAALQGEVLRLQGLLEAAATPRGCAARLHRGDPAGATSPPRALTLPHPTISPPPPRRPWTLLTWLVQGTAGALLRAGVALDTLLLLAASLLQAAGLRHVAMLVSVGLGGVLQLAWILAGIAAWPSHVDTPAAWH
ncbi:hypothetical protein ACKKBF_B35985 [Auxenochlorella protothecoides x Auxenochlorella symbiontica]